jgi:AraC family transcriptional regulator
MSRYASPSYAIRLDDPVAGAANWDLSASAAQRYAQPPSRKRIDGRRMSRVIQFVGEHIAGNITVADLAGAACMSPAHFARSFKLTTGQCPHEFVNQIRLALAKQMLANPHLPISDIALSTGFSSQSNFSRTFRGATGMTPRDFRASSAVFE